MALRHAKVVVDLDLMKIRPHNRPQNWATTGGYLQTTTQPTPEITYPKDEFGWQSSLAKETPAPWVSHTEQFYTM